MPLITASAAVGQKITASFLNTIRGFVNQQESTMIIPTSVAGTGVSVNAQGLITCAATPTLNVIGAFTSAYDDYRIRIRIQSKSAGGDLIFRLRSGGVDSSASYINVRNYSFGATNTADAPASTSLPIDAGGSTGRSFTIIELDSPNVATQTEFLARVVGASGTYRVDIGAEHSLTSAYPDFTLTINGAITFNGTVQIFGINKGS